MKMKLIVTILVCVAAAGIASAQSPSIIQNTRSTMNGVSSTTTAASNQALGVQQTAPAPANPTHNPAKSSGNAVVGVKSSPSNAGTESKHAAKHKPHAKGAVVVGTVVPATANPAAGAIVATKPGSESGDAVNAEGEELAPDAKYRANGRRDPFVSPVVSHSGGSGCSTGKKCLEIGAINLRGVVHSEGGFIAVVSNSMNKAYFLRENDPVFNGYVVKITGDSIVFQETLQDRVGKSFTREVVKKITTPAV
jgi:hypothetical protein